MSVSCAHVSRRCGARQGDRWSAVPSLLRGVCGFSALYPWTERRCPRVPRWSMGRPARGPRDRCQRPDANRGTTARPRMNDTIAVAACLDQGPAAQDATMEPGPQSLVDRPRGRRGRQVDHLAPLQHGRRPSSGTWGPRQDGVVTNENTSKSRICRTDRHGPDPRGGGARVSAGCREGRAMSTIAVAWVNRGDNSIVWCRAKRKSTTVYQDSVQTLCNHYVIGPCGFSADGPTTCKECLAIEDAPTASAPGPSRTTTR